MWGPDNLIGKLHQKCVAPVDWLTLGKNIWTYVIFKQLDYESQESCTYVCRLFNKWSKTILVGNKRWYPKTAFLIECGRPLRSTYVDTIVPSKQSRQKNVLEVQEGVITRVARNTKKKEPKPRRKHVSKRPCSQDLKKSSKHFEFFESDNGPPFCDQCGICVSGPNRDPPDGVACLCNDCANGYTRTLVCWDCRRYINYCECSDYCEMSPSCMCDYCLDYYSKFCDNTLECRCYLC